MSALLSKAVQLGEAARGYRFGSEGEDGYYDCSGLVYASAKAVGVYRGERFTTWTILHHPSVSVQFLRLHVTPIVGDIVVWAENEAHGHMGIVSGPDRFYSAESVHDGIGYGRISTMHAYPVSPVYLRPFATAPHAPAPTPTYTVRDGDNLYSLAKRWGVTLTAVEHANPHAGHPAGNFNLIKPGDVLHIP